MAQLETRFMFRFGTTRRTPPLRPPQPRLLVVEDDPDLSLIVRRAASLASRDLEVDVAATAEEARSLLRTRRYSVVLLDNLLDGQNRGIDLVPLVRRRQRGAVIAMMSSMSVDDLIELTTPYGTLPLVPKPFSSEAIRLFLHDALDLPGIRRAHVAPLD